MFKFFRTWLARRRCQHEWDEGRLMHSGMVKVFTCRKCGDTEAV